MQVKKLKIGVFGDSISEGIGRRKHNYSMPLKQLLLNAGYDSDIINLAHTGTTIKYINEIHDQFNPSDFDVVILAYGNVDGMLRPDLDHVPNYYKYLPKRYKQNGMLNPRPYYSRSIFKSSIQHLDSFFRWNLNKLLLKLQGATTWITLSDFLGEYSRATEMFSKQALVISLSTVKVSDKYFPGTNESYRKFNGRILECTRKYNTVYVDLYDSLSDKNFYYSDDFHPNETGYELIAKMIFDVIISNL